MATQYIISTGSATMVAATAKTLIEIPTGSTLPLVVFAMEITSAATAAGTLVIEWGTYTVTGTGTTATPQKYGPDQSVAAVLGTVKILDTVEPTSFSAGTLPTYVIPLPGMYSIIWPFGREFYQPISVLRALRATSSIAAPVRINLYIEQ
jgi:hypothetical protein